MGIRFQSYMDDNYEGIVKSICVELTQRLGERQWTVVGPLLDASPLFQKSCSAPSVSAGPGPAAPAASFPLNTSHLA